MMKCVICKIDMQNCLGDGVYRCGARFECNDGIIEICPRCVQESQYIVTTPQNDKTVKITGLQINIRKEQKEPVTE